MIHENANHECPVVAVAAGVCGPDEPPHVSTAFSYRPRHQDKLIRQADHLAAMSDMQSRLAAAEDALQERRGIVVGYIDANQALHERIAELEAEAQKLRAQVGKLASAERRAITFGDIVQSHTIAMRAAVVASTLQDPEAGMRWIVNTLAGPGHLPNMDEARALGGAQKLWDKETAEHEAFRAAHPAPGGAA